MTLGSTVKKVKEKPTWEGVRFIRARKTAVDERHRAVMVTWEEFLASANTEELELPVHQTGQYNMLQVEQQLGVLEDEVAECELLMAGQPAARELARAPNTAFLERLAVPKFSGEGQAYPDFKALFCELTSHMQHSEIKI